MQEDVEGVVHARATTSPRIMMAGSRHKLYPAQDRLAGWHGSIDIYTGLAYTAKLLACCKQASEACTRCWEHVICC